MKNKIYKIAALVLFTTASVFQSQAQLTIPQPSPKASVMQTVGLTDITIDYSSPGVKGRTIWGELEKYDEVWRAGANSTTKITFSKEVTINETKVPKGTYSIFIIPSSGSDWVFIINKNTTASETDYKQAEDVVRINCKSEAIPMRERLAYTITDFTNEQTVVSMEWEKVRVSFTVKVDTDKQATENIDNTVNGIWRTYANAARYMLENKKDYDAGLKYIDQSLKLKDDWYNNWIKAQLLAAKNNKVQALVLAKKAKTLGDKNPDGFFYKDQVEKALKDWSTTKK